MKPQSAAFLDKARQLLEQAEAVRLIALPDAAGRAAYLAAYHAAQALIFERGDRVFNQRDFRCAAEYSDAPVIFDLSMPALRLDMR